MKSKLIKISFTVICFGVGLTAINYSQISAAKSVNLNKQVNQQLNQQSVLLRKQGQAGLDQFLKAHANELKNPSPQLRQALDSLCQQKDCHASQLFWYTDLEQAKAAAKASNKPILSLRLLGRLDQDLSCANSRFFRVALYPNQEISQYLRNNYILHWQSVRNAPTVTVDFGNGRKLERTITGNSIHYILDASGRPMEAIPGLYGPKAFLQQLTVGHKLVKEYSQTSPNTKAKFLRDYHQQRLAKLQTQWNQDLAKLGIKNPPRLLATSTTTNKPPSAPVAGTIAVAKMATEAPMLRNLSPATSNPAPLSEITDQATWQRIAQLYQPQVKLDANSIALIASKRWQKGNNTNLQRVINNFETAIALDTVRNEYRLHTQIHQWFSQSNNPNTNNLDSLNEKVYAELFLTPNSDPWLGLVNSESYSAVENDGVRE